MSTLQRRVNGQTDNYFLAPQQVVGPGGDRYNSTIGTFELVQNSKSLSGKYLFTGDLLSLSVAAQLENRKFYCGVIIDDYQAYKLQAHVDFCLNNGQVVSSWPINKQYAPPPQNAPGSLNGQEPICLIPATHIERNQISTQFADDIPNLPCDLIQNELIGNLTYNDTADDFYYYWRTSPIHFHGMFNQIKFIVDNWTANPNNTGAGNHNGLMTVVLACLSQRYA